MSKWRGLTIGCVCLMWATGCGNRTLVGLETEDASNIEAVEVQESACKAGEANAETDRTLHTRVITPLGREMVMDSRVEFKDDDTVQLTRTITVDGELLMSSEAYGDGQLMEMSVEYGPLVDGMNTAYAKFSGGEISGMINGRELVPQSADADPQSAKFADAAPAPDMLIDPDIEDGMLALMLAAERTIDECPRAQNGEPNSMRMLLGGAGNDHGHDSDPETDLECIFCWTGCSASFVGCAIGVSAACAAAGPFYVVCEVIALAGCGAAYALCQYGCYNGGPCCPSECGDVACCDEGETCLNEQTGLCCDEGKTACVGESCCSSTEVCIGQGAEAGTCCEAESLCGSTCCGALETCVPGKNICCGFNNAACGDGCCAEGDVCLGDSCCPAAQACGNTCCPDGSSCDDATKTCQSCPSDHFACNVGGCCPNGKVCTDVEGICCEQGEYYCGGACRPLNECIQ